jgi:hypothetical protein
MTAGALVDLNVLDQRLGSEAIIFTSGSDVVQAPLTTAEPKATLSHRTITHMPTCQMTPTDRQLRVLERLEEESKNQISLPLGRWTC